jgi:hypothetical protein
VDLIYLQFWTLKPNEYIPPKGTRMMNSKKKKKKKKLYAGITQYGDMISDGGNIEAASPCFAFIQNKKQPNVSVLRILQ